MLNRGGKDLGGPRRRPLSGTGFGAVRVWTIMETSVVRVGANLALDLEYLLLLLTLLRYRRRRDRRRHRTVWVRLIFQRRQDRSELLLFDVPLTPDPPLVQRGQLPILNPRRKRQQPNRRSCSACGKRKRNFARNTNSSRRRTQTILQG